MSNDTTAAAPESPSFESIVSAAGRFLKKLLLNIPMLQSIVGGIIANIIFLVGIGLTGAIQIAFSWSWSFFLMVLWIIAAILALIAIPVAVSYHNDPGDGRDKAGWAESAGMGAVIILGNIIIWPFVVTLIDALHISIHHATSGCH